MDHSIFIQRPQPRRSVTFPAATTPVADLRRSIAAEGVAEAHVYRDCIELVGTPGDLGALVGVVLGHFTAPDARAITGLRVRDFRMSGQPQPDVALYASWAAAPIATAS